MSSALLIFWELLLTVYPILYRQNAGVNTVISLPALVVYALTAEHLILFVQSSFGQPLEQVGGFFVISASCPICPAIIAFAPSMENGFRICSANVSHRIERNAFLIFSIFASSFPIF